MESESKASYYVETANEAALEDKLRKPKDTMDPLGFAVVPFRSQIPSKQFYDIEAKDDASRVIDVAEAREPHVREAPPLEVVDASRVGEFTPLQWQYHHDQLTLYSNRLLADSDSLRQKSLQNSSHLRTKTETMQKETTKALDDRVRETLDAKELLLNHIEKATREMDLLQDMRRRLRKSLQTIELPENNNNECCHIRHFRVGIDNTRDGVTYALNKEAETLRTGRDLLTKACSEILEALHRLFEIKRVLEHDWSDKVESMQIDHSAAKLQINPTLAQFKPVSEALNEGSSTPASWHNRIDKHVASCNLEVANDTQLRASSNQAMAEVCHDVISSDDNVNKALYISIGKLETALSTLKEQDGQIRREIANQEINITHLREELQHKESPLQVAQTRHYNRSFRPGMDRCLDEPHYGLKMEVEELPKTISTLRIQVGDSEKILEKLHRQHEDLLMNIVEREHALSLEKRCVDVRKCKPSPGILQGF